MKRMTTRVYGKSSLVKGMSIFDIEEAVDRLAAYEDTGLEPKEIDEVFDEYNDVLKAIIKDGERMITNDRLRELAEADREDAAHIGACGFCEYYQMDKFCCCPDWVEDGYAIIRKPKDYCTKFKKANWVDEVWGEHGCPSCPGYKLEKAALEE